MDTGKYNIKKKHLEIFITAFCFAIMVGKQLYQICVWFSSDLYRKYSGLFFLNIANKKRVEKMEKKFFLSYFSALIKQVNKSIDGTADDEDEGVPTDQAIRAGLELLKVNMLTLKFRHLSA